MMVNSDIKVLHICYSDFIFCYDMEILYILKKCRQKVLFAFQLCQKEGALPYLQFLSHSLGVFHQLTISSYLIN